MKVNDVLKIRNYILYVIFFILSFTIDDFPIENLFARRALSVAAVSFYIYLVVMWAVTVWRKVIQKCIRRSLISASFVLLIWYVIRTIKFWNFTEEVLIGRLMWYSYYVCLLAEVYILFYIVLCIGKRDDYKPPMWARWLVVLFIIPAVLIMTNELHGLAFNFTVVPGEYTYGPVFFFIIALGLATTIFCFFKLVTIPDIRANAGMLIYPLSVILIEVLYIILYRFVTILRALDMTTGIGIAFISFYESLIATGMILTNTEYGWCMNHSIVRAQIMDARGNSIFRAEESHPITEKLWHDLISDGTAAFDANTELVEAPIPGGYVVWERDLSDINRSFSKISDTKTSIEEANETLKFNIAMESRQYAIEENNRLYDLVFSRISTELDRLSLYMGMAKEATEEELRNVLIIIDVCGVFIKRKSNLILLGETKDVKFARELKLCFGETFKNISRAGVETALLIDEDLELKMEEALALYSAGEHLLKAELFPKSIAVIVKGDENSIRMTASCEKHEGNDIAISMLERELMESLSLVDGTFEIENEEENYSVFINLKKGGTNND